MTTPRCDFLDHARLRHAPELRALAIDALFEVALRYGTRFRLEFDASRLLAVLGSAQAAALLPGQPVPTAGPLERREEPLAEDRARLLRKVVSFGPGEWPDPPINYIEKVILFDEQGNILLSASDNAEFILFALPQEGRDNLIERYRAAGIPVNTIQPVDVDINDTARPLCSPSRCALRRWADQTGTMGRPGPASARHGGRPSGARPGAGDRPHRRQPHTGSAW
jgi:hypothetical protein